MDGHNWLYHLAFGIFYSKTEDNWKWFMQQLHRAIGTPDGLVICTDACKGLGTAVGAVFPQAEYRECMRHMYSNFIKHYQGMSSLITCTLQQEVTQKNSLSGT